MSDASRLACAAPVDRNRADGPRSSGAVAALLDTIVAISSSLDVRRALERLVAAAREVAGAHDVMLVVTDDYGHVTDVFTNRRGVVRPDRGLDAQGNTSVRLSDRTEDWPEGAAALCLPVLLRGVTLGAIHLNREADQPAFTGAELRAVEALANAAGFLIDNARTQSRNEVRRRWLETSAWLSEALRPPIDAQLALGRITEVGRSIGGANATAFVQWPSDTNPIVTAADGAERDALDLLNELVTSPRLLSAPDDVLEFRVGDRRALVFPLGAQVAVPAALVVLFEAANQLPGVEERGALESLAAQASLTLDRVQAVADRTDLRDVAYRDRESRELLDVVIQRMFATGLQLQGVRAGVEDLATAERLDLAIEDIDVTIRHIREALVATDVAPSGEESPGHG